jgi:hypothetical protein
MHRVTENPSEFSPGNYLRTVQKGFSCLFRNGAPSHEAYGGVYVQFHAFLMSVLDEME